MLKNLLTKNTQAFISLFNKLHDGIIIHAQDTSIIYANPSACSILGMNADELLGKSTTNHEWYFIDEDYKKLEVTDYPVYKLFHSVNLIEHQIIGLYDSDSNLKWVDVNGSTTISNNNEKIALIVLSDVTERKKTYDEITLFKHLVDVANTGITISDPNQEDNPLIYVNKTFTKITGYSSEDALGKNCRFLNNHENHKEINKEELNTIREALKNQESCEIQIQNYTKDDRVFYNLLNISPLFEKDKLKYFIGVQHDITKQKEQEDLLSEQNLYIQSILNAQDDMVFVNNSKSIIFANQALYNFFGVASLEKFLEKSSCVCHFFEKHSSYFHLGLIQENENWIEKINEWPKEKRIVSIQDTKNKSNYFKFSSQKISNDKNVITLNNITQEVETKLLLTSKAYKDPLTQAYNRQYFYEYVLTQILNNANKNYGVIMSDIDNFKSINDIYGHSGGDEALKVLVKTLKSSLRKDDSIVRWGGEEFICIVEVISISEIAKIAENLRKSVEQIDIKNIRKFTSSFGISMIKENESIDLTIQRADEALYEAKKNGKNRVEANF